MEEYLAGEEEEERTFTMDGKFWVGPILLQKG